MTAQGYTMLAYGLAAALLFGYALRLTLKLR